MSIDTSDKSTVIGSGTAGLAFGFTKLASTNSFTVNCGRFVKSGSAE